MFLKSSDKSRSKFNRAKSMLSVPVQFFKGSLRNHDDDANKNVRNLHIWLWKTLVLHALHEQFSFLTFRRRSRQFLRRETTCFPVVRTTWAYDDKCSILSFGEGEGERDSMLCYNWFSVISVCGKSTANTTEIVNLDVD